MLAVLVLATYVFVPEYHVRKQLTRTNEEFNLGRRWMIDGALRRETMA